MKTITLIFFSLCFFVLLPAGNLSAQTNVQNNGILFVSAASDTLFMGSSFTNAAGAAFTNNSVVNIKQDITNGEVAMATGTGTLYLNGTSTQVITGAEIFKTYNLITNNSAGFTLNNNLSISGLHTYTAGIITTSVTPNYMVYQAGSNYSGDDDSRHVNGWVKKIGNTDFVFPVGNGTYKRTVALTNMTVSSEFNAKHNSPSTPNYANLFPPLVLIDTNEYWTINKVSGGSALVEMNWDHSKIPVPQVLLSSVRAAYYNGSFWVNIGGTGSGNIATTGSVTSNSVSAFNNNFTIASTSWVLPLQLISFSGQHYSTYNKISWVVSNEADVVHYKLQRSNDGVNFYTVSQQSANNNNSTETYTVTDGGTMYGKAYYRLAYLQTDGQVKYSGVIIINAAQDKDFYVIKNPVSTSIEIYAGSTFKGTYSYTLTNSTGQIMQSGTVAIITEGVQQVKLRSYLATGIYVLTLRNADHLLQKNILKE
jgi:hypothetical protein